MDVMGHFVSAPATLHGLIQTLTVARHVSVSMIGQISRCVDHGNVMSLENAQKITSQGITIFSTSEENVSVSFDSCNFYFYGMIGQFWS